MIISVQQGVARVAPKISETASFSSGSLAEGIAPNDPDFQISFLRSL